MKYKNNVKLLTATLLASLLLGCGGEESSSNTSGSNNNNDGNSNSNSEYDRLTTLDPSNPNPNNAQCNPASSDINWSAVTREVSSFMHNCEKLSDYNFFEDATNPTNNLNLANGDKGTIYEMNVELFTDYARKYRFVILPSGEQIPYKEDETFDFPVGTVLIKTFVVPDSTSNAKGVGEELIETRLLIRRDSGWVALPYVWNEAKTDAQLTAVSIPFSKNIVHKGNDIEFTYNIPSRSQCTFCHNVLEPIVHKNELDGYKADKIAAQLAGTDLDMSNYTIVQEAGFSPIGPKARNLNGDHTIEGQIVNQLKHWSDEGILLGLPENSADWDKGVPIMNTYEGIANLDSNSNDFVNDVEDYAKAYLDINCAHCHREEGKAGSNPFKLQYWKTDFGLCSKNITFSQGPSNYVITPGDASTSVLHYRMQMANGNLMPEFGRNTVHIEGVDLIETWINNMDYDSCN